MDERTFISLLNKQEESITKTFKSELKRVSAYVDAGAEMMNNRLDMTNAVLDGLLEKKKEQNGRIDKLEDTKAEQSELNQVKRETSVTRWAFRNPSVSIPGALIIIALFVIGYHFIDVRQTLKNVTKVELKDSLD